MRTAYPLSLIAALALTGRAAPPCAMRVTDYGASGGDRSLDTVAIQRALDDCARVGGGRVVFPRGRYRAGTLHLRSNVAMVFEEGAEIGGSEDPDDYLEPLARRPGDPHFVSSTASRRLFLYGDHVENVTIEGKGLIDGNRVREKSGGRGPLTIFIQHSSNIVLRDITVTRSPGWSVTFFDCRDVRILGVRLKDVMCDGINPVSCRNVLYDGVEVDGSGDDPICIKNEGPPLPGGYVTRNITVRNTRVRNTTHPAIKIGTGTHGIFENILVEDCNFDLPGDLFAIQLMRPSPAGERQRHIRGVVLRRLDVRNAGRVFDITVMGVERPVIEDLHFEDIRFRGAATGSRIEGTGVSPIRGVSVRGLKVEATRPAARWLNVRHVSGLRLEGVEFAGPALRLENVRDAVLSSLRGPVHVSGERSGGIRLEGDLVPKPIVAGPEVKAGALLPEAKVQAVKLAVPAEVSPNQTIEAVVDLAAPPAGGAARLSLEAEGRETGAAWVWLASGKPAQVSLAAAPFYRPGTYRVEAAGLARTVRVAATPAEFRYGEFCEIEWPRRYGSRARIVVPVRNVGGTPGAKRVELKAGGKVVASQEIRLGPGESGKVRFEEAVGGGMLHVGDYPEWSFATFRNVPGRYLLYPDRIVIEAGGRAGQWGDYAAVYVPEVEGDFDAQVRVRSATAHTGEYSAAGLIVRNRMDDLHSGGLSMHLRVPKYGGYKIWRWDADGDGVAETRSDGGGSALPIWYRLEKRGQTMRAFSSKDGEAWQPCGMPGQREFTSEHTAAVQDVGFYATAWDSSGTRARVEFSDFSVRRLGAAAGQRKENATARYPRRCAPMPTP